MQFDGIDADHIRNQLKRIEASRTFRNVVKQRELLRFVVDERIGGREEQLTMSVIASALFEGDDDKMRSIASRMRANLLKYYHTEAPWDPIRIDVPESKYIPKFRSQSPRDTEAAVGLNRSSDAFDLQQYREALRLKYDAVPLELLAMDPRGEPLRIKLRTLVVDRDIRHLDLPPIKPSAAGPPSRGTGALSPKRLALPASTVLLACGLPDRIVLLADAGSGKSTLIRHAALALLDISREIQARIPFVIELKTFVAYRSQRLCDTFLEYLAFVSKIEAWHLTSAALNSILQERECLVCFDGLDEVNEATQRGYLQLQVAAFAREYSKASVVVTSRPSLYTRRILDDAAFTHFTLVPLDMPRILQIAEALYSLTTAPLEGTTAAKGRLVSALETSERMLEMATNPLLLTLLLILGSDRDGVPFRAQLLESAIDILIEHWELGKDCAASSRASELLSHHKKSILCAIAAAMHERVIVQKEGKTGSLNRTAMVGVVKRVLSETLKMSPWDAELCAHEIIGTLHNRSGLLRSVGTQTYGFAHDLFYDYLVASHIVSSCDPAQLIELFRSCWVDGYWTEILCLVCGMVERPTASRLVEFLAFQIQPLNSTAGIPWNVFVALRCLGERSKGDLSNCLSSHLLRTVCDLIDLWNDIDAPDYFLRMLVDAATYCSEHWIDKELVLIEWLSTRREAPSISLLAAIFGRVAHPPSSLNILLGRLGRGSPLVQDFLMKLLESDSPRDRILAPCALAVGWPHEEPTRQALHRSLRDSVDDIRFAAFDALSDAYPLEVETFEIIRSCALSDPYELIREFATEQLYRRHGARSDVAETLKTLSSDPVSRVRQPAINGLSELFSDDPLARRIVLDRIAGDPDRYVRAAAATSIQAWGSRFREEAEDWMVECAANERDLSVRLAIQKCLFMSVPAMRDSIRRQIEAEYETVEDGNIRADVISAFAEMSALDSSCTELILHRGLIDRDQCVRLKAISSLPKLLLNDSELYSLMLRAATGDPDREVRQTATRIMSDHASLEDTRLKDLIGLLNDKDTGVCQRVIWVLAVDFPDCDEAFEVVKEIVRRTEVTADLRAYALRALKVYSRRSEETQMIVREVAHELELDEVSWTAFELLAEQETGIERNKVGTVLAGVLGLISREISECGANSADEARLLNKLKYGRERAIELLLKCFPYRAIEELHALADRRELGMESRWLIRALGRARNPMQREEINSISALMGLKDPVLDWWLISSHTGRLPFLCDGGSED